MSKKLSPYDKPTMYKEAELSASADTKVINTAKFSCCDEQDVFYFLDKDPYYKCKSCSIKWHVKHLDKEEKTQGKKTKEGKLRWDLLPYDALEEVVKVMTSGVKEYGERNWELGISYADLAAAMQRHFVKWFQRRIDLDEKTNLPNLAHLIANAMYLLAYQIREMNEFDDRPNTKDYFKDKPYDCLVDGHKYGESTISGECPINPKDKYYTLVCKECGKTVELFKL